MSTQGEKNACPRVILQIPFSRKVLISNIFPIISIIDISQKLSILVANSTISAGLSFEPRSNTTACLEPQVLVWGSENNVTVCRRRRLNKNTQNQLNFIPRWGDTKVSGPVVV